MRIAEGDGFVTVSMHANRALLLRGYHRTFACARYIREASNAPHGVLFGVSNQLQSIGNAADDVLRAMEGPRPPRMADLFDERLFLPVMLRRRRYQMRIHCELAEMYEEEAAAAGGQSPGSVTAARADTSRKEIEAEPAPRDVQGILAERRAASLQAGRIGEASHSRSTPFSCARTMPMPTTTWAFCWWHKPERMRR